MIRGAMSLHHFFLEDQVLADEGDAVFPLRLAADNLKHAHVLRLQPGEHVAVVDAASDYFECEVVSFDADGMTVRIASKLDAPARPHVVLLQGIAKGEKMDQVVRHATELGVSGIVPLACERSIVKLDAKKEEAKRKRWYGISESAAKQSKRMIVPEIGNVMKFKAAIEAAALDDLAIIPYEDSESLPGAGGMALTRELIGSLKPGQSLSIFIGPEGGFSDGEVELAMQSGVKPVTLGKRILRTETAGMFVMAAVGLLLE